MTATMPETYQKELNFLDCVDYITGENQLKLERWQKTVQKRQYRNKVIRRIAAKPNEVKNKICTYLSRHYELDRRIIVTIETIEDLIPVYQSSKNRTGERIFFSITVDFLICDVKESIEN